MSQFEFQRLDAILEPGFNSYTLGTKQSVVKKCQSTSEPMATLAHLGLRLTACYLFGLFAGNLVFSPYARGLTAILMIGGMILALPLFGIALIILLLFHRHIQANLLGWCLAGPPAVIAVYLAVDPPVNRAAIERVLLAAVCATFSAGLFYTWNKAHPLSGQTTPNSN
jgi:hypothetical protein